MALDETRLIVSIDSRNAERDARNITRELQNLERGGNQASNSMGSLSAATRSLAGYMGGLLTVAAAVNKMDVYTGLQNRLKLVTNSQTELNTAMNDTFAIAQKTASSWDSAAMVYQRFADNAVRLNITMKETAALTETVAKAISVSGGSAASAEAALMQFGQALASGVLRGEEFNSIAEQAPGLLKAIAFGLDTNVGSLRAMAAAGKITGDVLVQSLTKAQPYIDDLFNKTDFTIAASFTKLSNEVTKFIGEAGKGSGAAAGLSDAISVLAENLGTIANIAVIGGVAMLTKAIATQTVAIYGSVTASIARRSAMFAELGATAAASAAEVVRTGAIADHAAMQVLDAKASAARMTGMQKLAFVQSTLIPLEAKATQATAAHTAATTADTAVQELNNKARTRGAMLLTAVGGPIGALTLGVTALAAGYLFLKDSSSGTNDSLSNQIEIVSELAQKYRELTLEKLINEMGELEKKQAQGSAQSSKAIAGIMGIVVATEYSTQAQKDRANEWNKIAIDVRNGAMLTGAAIGEMTKKGFTKEEIQKASAFFAEFNDGKVKANEAAQSIAFVAQQTGLYGDKLDETGKKIAEKKLIVKGLEGDYRSLSTQIDTNIQWLLQQDGALNASTEQQKNIANATDAWNSKTITASELAKALKANLPIDSGLLVGFDNLATKTDKAKKELNTANYELKQVQINGPKAKQGFAEAGQGAADAENDVSKLNEKLAAFNKTLESRKWDAQFKLRLVQDKGYTEDRAEELLKAYKESVSKNAKNISSETGKALREAWTAEDQLKKVVDSRLEAEKKVTQEKNKQSKESEKQSKLGQRLIGVSGNSGIGTGAHLDVRYGGSRDGQKVSKEHLARLQAGGKSLSNYRVSSDYGNRKAPTKGASSFHKGIDFAMPVGTPITTKVAVKDVKTAYDSKGGGYYSTVTFEDGVVLKLLHQSPSMQGKVKGGASDGTLKSNQDIEKQAEQQANTQIQLQMAAATKIKRIETQLQEDIKEINKAGFSPEETKRLTTEYQTRADNEIAIAKYALKTKLDDYGAFKKTESELLKDSFDEKKFYAAHDLELDAEGRKKAVALLDEQLKEELQNIQDAMDSRIFQYKEAMMTETQVMQERYRLERDEILKTANAAEMAAKLAAFNESTIRGGVGKNFSDPNDMNSQFLKSASYTAIPKTNTEKLDEDYAKTLQKLTDNLNAVKDAENASYEERLEAKRVFDEAKQQMDDEYYFKTQDARKADHENQLGFYSQMLGQASTVWGSMTQMVKDAKGENSKTFKAMFLAQQAMAIAQQIINTELAAGATTAQTGIFGLPAATAIRAVGYASVGMIAAQTIAGFETGGYTGSGGRKDIAGVVHGQEYVLNAAATKRVGVDTLNAVNSGKGDLGGGGAVVQPIINIHTLAGETAEVTTNEDGSIDVRIRKVVGDYMQAEFSNQNSKTSQSLKQNFNIAPKR